MGKNEEKFLNEIVSVLIFVDFKFFVEQIREKFQKNFLNVKLGIEKIKIKVGLLYELFFKKGVFEYVCVFDNEYLFWVFIV